MQNMEKERKSSKQYGSLEKTQVDGEAEKSSEFGEACLDLAGCSDSYCAK